MAERLKAHAWKACVRESVPWVRIPLPPPECILDLSASVRRRSKNPEKTKISYRTGTKPCPLRDAVACPKPASYDGLGDGLAAPYKSSPSFGPEIELPALEALPYADMPGFMVALRVADGMAAKALRFTILTAARTGEALGATWAEIDLESRLWTVPAERMKAGKEHRVPLSEPVLALLCDLYQTRQGAPVFPGANSEREKSGPVWSVMGCRPPTVELGNPAHK
jgi:integrase